MRRTRILRLAVLVVGLSLTVSFGQERSTDGPCAEAMTTVEMRLCLHQRYQHLDQELNRVYRLLMSQVSKARQTKLRAAQRAWLAFRDKHAEFVASAEAGGSMEPLGYLLALTSITERRVETLKRLLTGKDI